MKEVFPKQGLRDRMPLYNNGNNGESADMAINS
jgi:hypothetical protein